MRDKRIILVAVLVVVALVLGGVVYAVTRTKPAAPAEPAQPEPQQEEQTEQKEEPKESKLKADPAVALAMSNHHDEGLFLVDGDQVYYSDFDGDGRAMLVRSDLDGKGKKTVRKDCDASYLTEYKDAVYMIIWTRDEAPVLCTMEKDGSGFKKLVEGAVDLQIEDGRLYYNKADTTEQSDITNAGYYNSELDGSGESQLLDKETYDNYVVDGKIYYQDEKDDQTVHVMDMETQEDKRLTKTHSHGFVVDGDTAYYIDTEDSSDATTGNLIEMDLETGKTKVLAGEAYKDVLIVREHNLLYCDGENNYHLSQIDKGLSGKKEIASIDNPDYVYATEDRILFFDYDYNWRYVEGVYSCGGSDEYLKRLDE